MKHEELAFLNQQLAGMLREGIPLEGAIKQLCKTMRRGDLKQELEALESELSKGVPLDQALDARKLPPFYKQMLKVGFKSNNLPATLTLVADHYHGLNTLKIKLKGLMIYPVIVLIVCLSISLVLSVLLTHLLTGGFASSEIFVFGSPAERYTVPMEFLVRIWGLPTLLGLLFLFVLLAVMIPQLRHFLNWKLPGFREVSLARFGNSMWLLLKGGAPLNDSVKFLESLEMNSSLRKELNQWSERLSSGQGKFEQMSAGGKTIPPLFRWLVGNGGEDLASGFKQAGEVYASRAFFKTDILLQAALPVSILGLGILIIVQITPFLQMLTAVLESL